MNIFCEAFNFLHNSSSPQKRKVGTMFRNLHVLPAILIVVAGCSDSGDSGGGGNDGRSAAALEEFLIAQEPDVTPPQAAFAARATPRFNVSNGGVTQSSGAANSVINVEIGGTEGSRTYTITNPISAPGTGGFPLGTGDALAPEDDSETGSNIVRFVKEERAGNTYLFLNSDALPDVHGAANYLAYGFWIHDPAAESATPTVGAFIDSASTLIFDPAHVPPLTGTAEYAGDAEGLYYGLQDSETAFFSFTAEVELSADFGTFATLGQIEGTVDSFRTGNAEVDALFGSTTITLETAPLTANFNTFTGGTLAMVEIGEEEPVPFTGEWGGQFFDTDTTIQTDTPGIAAGTFGLADPLNTQTVLGIFYTTLQP